MTANHGSWSSVLLALRSLLWTILLPGFVRGLYRYVRNPMYLSVTTIVLGETLLTSSAALGVYWVIWFVVANLFVMDRYTASDENFVLIMPRATVSAV